MRVVVDPVRAVSRESIRMPGAASTHGPKLRALPVQPASSLFSLSHECCLFRLGPSAFAE